MKRLGLLLCAALLLAGCEDIPPSPGGVHRKAPTCWNANALAPQQQRWFQAGADYWGVAFDYANPACLNLVQMTALDNPAVLGEIDWVAARWLIRFNSQVDWSACRIKDNVVILPPRTHDFVTAAAHEVGHALEQPHGVAAGDVMTPGADCALIYEGD